MKLHRFGLLASAILIASCASVERGTIGQLRHSSLELKDEPIEGGIEKAMQGYQKFLEQTPESAMTPEAIRRLADLKLEREYGALEGARGGRSTAPAAAVLPAPARPEARTPAAVAVAAGTPGAPAPVLVAGPRESQRDFEKRAAQSAPLAATERPLALPETGMDLHNAGALEAIELYKQLLAKYPHYERNDQVLYQMSRAHEELGQVDEAMTVMNRLAQDYPDSRYADEIQFRRGEYFFTRRKYRDAEAAYQAIAKAGEHSAYYELALYKLGWTFYKQDVHDEALQQFMALLDYKVKTGYDFENPKDDFERKRVEDTHRVISLSFSAEGGAEAVAAWFAKHGRRSYEVSIYGNLGEHYLEKRRYADAAQAYQAFVRQNPWHKVAPQFDMRVIEIYKQGDFPQLVIEANKNYAHRYGLKAEYWQHHDQAAYPQVMGYLKGNLKELASHYHALYQDKTLAKEKPGNFREAAHWYGEFLASFPQDSEAPGMNHQFADLLLENRDFARAAQEYERTAYGYPVHARAAGAGYAAVYAHREHLEGVAAAEKDGVRRATITSSLRFAETFPQHEKAALVMGAALDDLFGLKDYEAAVVNGRKMLAMFPQAEAPLRRGAWLVIAHSSFELARYADAEQGYAGVLALTAPEDKSREGLVESLAASIYKQGEQAVAAADFNAAAKHFLRVGEAAPTAKIRPAADYDAAEALVSIKDWERAATVLLAFRKNHPGHALQPEVTKKVAFVYQEAGKLALAAAEYERIETESRDEPTRREALQMAAELYLKANEADKALTVYRRAIAHFPQPVEGALELRHKVAGILKGRSDRDGYLKELRLIVDTDLKAGTQRTERTRYLGATAALELTEPLYAEFAAIKLTQPFDVALKKKKAALKAANTAFGKLVEYEVGDVTAAATFYIAETYFNFSDALKNSERPADIAGLEAEQYEEALDEQAYPFEEKAIQIHQKNIDFIPQGLYNAWIDKSMARLATLMPGRYAKFEESAGYIAAIDTTSYQALTELPPPPAALPAAPATSPENTDAVPAELPADTPPAIPAAAPTGFVPVAFGG
jgi:TolA-binding protein